MKILIAYVSYTGTVEECVARLANGLTGLDVTLADLTRVTPDPKEFDAVVLGAPVRFDRFPTPFRNYLRTYEKTLCEVPHGLFLCCGLTHNGEEYAERFYPPKMRETAFLCESFGGTLRYERQNLFGKILIHAMRSNLRESEIEDGEYTPTLPGILPENIGKMATYTRAAAEKGKTL